MLIMRYIFALFLIEIISLVESATQSYSNGGILANVELAAKAADRGGTVLGFRSNKRAIIISWNSDIKDYEIKRSKILKLSNSIAMSASGIASDASYIKKICQEKLLNHEYVFGTEMRPLRLARDVSVVINKQTHSSSRRPYGVRVCIASYDETKKNPILYEIDPYGYLHDCDSFCFGSHSKDMLDYLTKERVDIEENQSVNAMIRDGLNCLRKCVEDTKSPTLPLNAKSLEIVIIDECGVSWVDDAILESFISK